MSSSLAYSTNAYPAKWKRARRFIFIIGVLSGVPYHRNRHRPHVPERLELAPRASSSASHASRPTNNVLYGSVSFGVGSRPSWGRTFPIVHAASPRASASSHSRCVPNARPWFPGRRGRAEVSAGFSPPRFGSSNSRRRRRRCPSTPGSSSAARGGMYSSGGRGSNRASKLGVNPSGAAGPRRLPRRREAAVASRRARRAAGIFGPGRRRVAPDREREGDRPRSPRALEAARPEARGVPERPRAPVSTTRPRARIRCEWPIEQRSLFT